MRPILPAFYGMNSPDGRSNCLRDLCQCDTFFEQQTDRSYTSFIKHRSPVLGTTMYLMRNSVSPVLWWETVCQIRRSVIVTISVFMTNFVSIWTISNENKRNKVVNIDSALVGVFWAFCQRNAPVRMIQIYFSKKSLTVF